MIYALWGQDSVSLLFPFSLGTCMIYVTFRVQTFWHSTSKQLIVLFITCVYNCNIFLAYMCDCVTFRVTIFCHSTSKHLIVLFITCVHICNIIIGLLLLQIIIGLFTSSLWMARDVICRSHLVAYFWCAIFLLNICLVVLL